MFNIDLYVLKTNICILFLNLFLVFFTYLISSNNIFNLSISLPITIGYLYYDGNLDKINGDDDIFLNCMKNIFLILFINLFLFSFIIMLYYHPLFTLSITTVILFCEYCKER
jgi:hypothetical protein